METSLAPVPLHVEGTLPRTYLSGKKHRFLECIFDVLLVIAAWHAAIELRVMLNHYMALKLSRETLERITPPLWGVIMLWIAAALWLNLYHKPQSLRRGTALLRVMESSTVFGGVTIVATFFSRTMGADLSRSFVLLFMPVCFVAMALSRYLGMFASSLIERYWPMAERVAVVAGQEHGSAVMERIRYFNGGKVAGLIVPNDEAVDPGNGTQILGRTSRLAELINTARIDRIILMEQRLSEQELQDCYQVSKRMGVTVTRIIGLPEPDARPHISEQFGLRLLEMKPLAFTRHQEMIKRTFDVVCSACTLFLILPLLLVLAGLIKATSRGGVFYCSRRVGKGGRHFTFLKFRTMYTGLEDRRGLEHQNEKNGHIFKMKNDPRVTPIGRLLRRWSLDELPQLINVLKGDMSMVGPRPLPANDLDPDGQSREFRAWAEQRSRVLPGISGLWQIRGRSELPFEKMVEFDIQYIQDWSIGLDLRILLETPVVLITGRGAY